MKILQIGPHPPPLGGWAYHITLLKQYMTEKGIKNQVLNLSTVSRKIKSSEYIDVQNGMDFILKNFKYNFKGYNIYYHVDGGPFKAMILNLTAEFIALCFGKKIIVSFHAGVWQACFEKKERLRRLLIQIILGLAKNVICNSKEVKSQLIGIGVSEKKIYPIPAFSYQYMAFEETLTKEQKLFLDSHHPILTSYLFYREEYTVDLLLELVQRLKIKEPHIGLIIVGGKRDFVESRKYDETIQNINKMGISDIIFLDSGLTHDNYLTIVKNSDIFVRTPISDGVSSSVLESIFLGVPVAASDNGTRPDGVITYENNNADDLYSAILSTLKQLNKIKTNLKKVEPKNTLEEELCVLLGKGKFFDT